MHQDLDYPSLQDDVENTLRLPPELRDLGSRKGQAESGELYQPVPARCPHPAAAGTPYHVGRQQTEGAPAGKVGAANTSRGRQAKEQLDERQEQGCQSGAPHGLPRDQGIQNMAAPPEGGWQGLAVQQQGVQCQQEPSPQPAPAPPCPKAPPQAQPASQATFLLLQVEGLKDTCPPENPTPLPGGQGGSCSGREITGKRPAQGQGDGWRLHPLRNSSYSCNTLQIRPAP